MYKMVHDEEHDCKKTEKRLPGEGEHSYWLRTLIKVDPRYMYFFLIPEALDFARLLGAHKPFRGEKNLRSTRLDFEALGKCKTSRDPGRENEVVLNSEIQFLQFWAHSLTFCVILLSGYGAKRKEEQEKVHP
jgi:hypothetical protein